VKALRNRNIGFVKVLWRNHQTEKATWEREEKIKEKYPKLILEFETFKDESSFYGVDNVNDEIIIIKLKKH